MNDAALDLAVNTYRAGQGPSRAYLVDDDDPLAKRLTAEGAEVHRLLSQHQGRPVDAFDLWYGTMPRGYRIAVIVRSAPSKDLYRVLHLAERLVTSSLLLVCPTDAMEDHRYVEASEVFLYTHPEYERVLHRKSNVLQLRRKASVSWVSS